LNINVQLVKKLIAAQFPHWAHLEVRPVEIDGNDNRTFHLGNEMSVRLPSHQRYANHVVVEHEWLLKLSKDLPLPIPVPVGKGKPSKEYPWPWTVNNWIPGEIASCERTLDCVDFAKDLANFLNALQAIDSTNAPVPGRDNFFRGGKLSVYNNETRENIDALSDVIDTDVATMIWDAALEERWDRPSVWVHGDIAVGNLLLQGGKLSAVIDFGQLAAGDPSCDTAIAWTLFSGSSRETFKAELKLEESTLIRGRGWALWKTLLNLRKHSDSELEKAYSCVVKNILDE